MPRRPGYTYPDDPARIAAFERWLANATDAVILGGSGDRRWTDDYVRYAYGRGVVHGNHRLQNAGYQVPDIELADTFNSPLHRETLATFYQRQYTLLNGVNAAMQTEIARTLTEGMLAGQNPTEIARTLTGRVSNVGIYRANVIARTEIIHAYNEGALNRFERILGAEGELEVVVELATAGDSRVCDICRDLEGVIYTVKDAHNVIPVHPQCRCTWVPRSRAS